VKFAGRTTFSMPPTKAELEEFAGDLVRQFQALDGSRAWRVLSTVRAFGSTIASAAASLGCALPVDTSDGATIDIQLPPVDARRGGQELAIVRQSASGTIRLVPPSGAMLDGSSSVATLTATAGYYVMLFDGVNYWRQR
jgi:hypothetical protein